MAKGKNFKLPGGDEELTAPAVSRTETISKMPIDTTGAAKRMSGFQEIPVSMLHPFTLKKGSDFSRHNEVLSEQFVNSIRSVGIIDALIVRESRQQMGMYEIIAGESRWEHAKAAGLAMVPCRIMNLSDEKATNIFNITNLMRRDLTPRDRVNGWYAFYMGIKEKGAVDDLEKTVEEEQQGVMTLVGGKGLTLRSIQRYVKMHNLIEDWLIQLDDEKISQRIGYHLAFFSADIQKQLLDYKLDEKNLVWLRTVYEGKDKAGVTWSEELIPATLSLLSSKKESDKEDVKPDEPKPKLSKEERAKLRQEKAYKRAFKTATPKIVDAARIYIQPEDYERADEIIEQALKLFYEAKKLKG